MAEYIENAVYSYTTGVFSNISLDQIDSAILWEQRDAPRAEAYYATENVPYTYGKGAGARTYYPQPYEKTSLYLAQIWSRVNISFETNFELLFCNKYADQHQHLGWHADDGEIIDHDRPIAVVSFGAEREIWFRKNEADDKQQLLLHHGSLLVMKPGVQLTHQHRIPKHHRPCGPRVSLTFRGLLKPKAMSIGL